MKSFKTYLKEITAQEIKDIREREGIKFSTDKGHPTQRANTKATYIKFFNSLPEELKSGLGLDYSAGLGIGSQTLRAEPYNANIESYEPFPHEEAQDITYSGLNSLPDTEYDYIINSAVLNVVEDDIRDAIVLDIWKHLKPNGIAIIGVRSRGDVLGAKTAYVVDHERGEIIDRTRGSFQKGFEPSELREYIQRLLPDAAVTRISGVTQVAVKISKDENIESLPVVTDVPKKKKSLVQKYIEGEI